MTDMDTAIEPDELEAQIRELLRTSGFVVREEARTSVIERWGDEWESMLQSAASRLSANGKFSWMEDNDKWIISDRDDILVMTGDGRVLVAAFKVCSPSEVRQRLVDGDFVISPWVSETIEERLEDGSIQDAINRIKEMARSSHIDWRHEADLTKGGWRMAMDGDVVFINVSGTAVTKFQWRMLDHRDMVSVDTVRRYLERAGSDGGIRIGERMRWRLDKSFGALWEAPVHDICIRASRDGTIEPNPDGNGFTVVLNGEASMIVSRDGEVAVSVRVTTSGDPNDILQRIKDGSIAVDSQAYGESSFYRAPAMDAWMHYARCVADDPQVEVEANSTHWVVSAGNIEIFVSHDGAKITGVRTSMLDSAEDACANVRRGGFWVWESALEAGEVESVDWFEGATAEEFRKTSRGWEWAKEGKPKVKLDKSAARAVALSKPSED